MKIFESVGRRVCEMADSAASDLAFIGETFASAASLIVRPRSFRFSDCALAFERASFNALPVTTGIGFLLGLILAFQSAAALKMFGVEVYVSDLLAIGLFRELGPLVTAIVLAGRTGSAFAAEIGTMKVDEELDALTTMGLSAFSSCRAYSRRYSRCLCSQYSRNSRDSSAARWCSR